MKGKYNSPGTDVLQNRGGDGQGGSLTVWGVGKEAF
jgi:hypothetical protein